MKKIVYALLISASIVSCKKEATEAQKEEAAELTNSSAETNKKATSECYLYARNKDTVKLDIVVQDKAVSGGLAYRYYEKDKSSGIVSGIVKGDTLVMTYEFMSEGMNSRRQVVFVRKDGGLTEGYGDVFEKDGVVLYKDIEQLEFPGTIVLMPGKCE